jgi:glycosyltransferase involved in cell wall biosynthesis
MSRHVIHILHHSPSRVSDAPLETLLSRSGWHVETAYQQQRYLPGVSVECWTMERKLSREVQRDVRGVLQRFFPAYGPGYLRELSPAISARLRGLDPARVDIFLHGSVGYLPSHLLLQFGRRFRVFAQNHGERPTARMYTNDRTKPLDYRLRLALERRALPRARRILCLNPASQGDYHALGIAPEKVLLSSMGVDLEHYTRDPEARRRERAALDLGEQPCLGFVGRLAAEKRVALLLQALAQLPAATRLVIAGDGPKSTQLTAQAAALGLRERVRFLGHVAAGARLNALYNAIDLLVLPSRQEGLGMVLLEALATGTPVVATDLSGPRTIVREDDGCGLLTLARDADELARDIGRALARSYEPDRLIARAAEFSWRSVCEGHGQLLLEP